MLRDAAGQLKTSDFRYILFCLAYLEIQKRTLKSIGRVVQQPRAFYKMIALRESVAIRRQQTELKGT